LNEHTYSPKEMLFTIRQFYFMEKKWSSNLFNLVELIEKDLNFKKELKPFKDSFEWDEVVNMQYAGRKQ